MRKGCSPDRALRFALTALFAGSISDDAAVVGNERLVWDLRSHYMVRLTEP
jgi:hypothetical protein